MNNIHRSQKYGHDRERYAKEREERMIEMLDDFYWKSFFMLRMNNVAGDYLEFGCGSNVRSFRLAYKYKVLEYAKPHLFAFDSFAGLPEISGIDRETHSQWRKGSMAVSIEAFNEVMGELGARQGQDYTCIEGFYNSTLDGKTPHDYGITKAAMVLVDCDLYASATSVLSFVSSVLVDGTILAFDDWYCYKGRPDRGEQLAFLEFVRANSHLSVVEFQKFGWHGKSFIVHVPDSECLDLKT